MVRLTTVALTIAVSTAAPANNEEPVLSSCPHSLHAQYLGVCQCDCTFVDVGLNDGDSLLSWYKTVRFKHTDAASGVKSCARGAGTACYYGFEANPVFNGTLLALESRLLNANVRVKVFVSTAFSTHADGALLFVQPPEHDAKATGSTLEPHKKISTMSSRGQFRVDVNRNAKNSYASARVASVDATAFLAAIVRDSNVTAVKVDVEGYEYELLSHVLLTRPQSLCELDLLAVEWHEGTRLPMHRGHRAHLEWMLDQRPCRVQAVPYV